MLSTLRRVAANALLHRRALAGAASGGGGGGDPSGKWRMLAQQGHNVNPCNSRYVASVLQGEWGAWLCEAAPAVVGLACWNAPAPRCPPPPKKKIKRLHPGAATGEIPVDDAAPELSVQEAYTPESRCFGCGPSSEAGLRLRSFRAGDGALVARTSLDAAYQAFPGIVNGGIVSALFDCHGNWTAAVALMDRACLPRPPLTLTAELLVNYREPTPPGTPLTVRSHVVRIKESSSPGSGKASVHVDLTLHSGGGPGGPPERLLATASGIFKKLGALRAL